MTKGLTYSIFKPGYPVAVGTIFNLGTSTIVLDLSNKGLSGRPSDEF